MTSPIVNAAALAVRGAVNVVRHVRTAVDPSSARPAGGGQPASGWLVVTVFVEPAAVDPEKLPAPLAEFGEPIEVRVRPAPGDKGTELAVRLRDQPRPGTALSRLTGTD